MAIVNLYTTNNKYDIIYADPPWRYNDVGSPYGAAKYYDVISIEDLKAMPVERVANENSVLLMWAVFPMMQEALDLMKAWGFTYKTVAFTWVKHNKKNMGWFLGVGSYTRSNAEVVLIGTKGKLQRASKGVLSVVDTPVMEHSVKPELIRKLIVELYGDRPRIELFARRTAKGWDSFGNELSDPE